MSGPAGSSSVARRSGGTVAIPTSRASEAAPTWISSSQEMEAVDGVGELHCIEHDDGRHLADRRVT